MADAVDIVLVAASALAGGVDAFLEAVWQEIKRHDHVCRTSGRGSIACAIVVVSGNEVCRGGSRDLILGIAEVGLVV